MSLKLTRCEGRRELDAERDECGSGWSRLTMLRGCGGCEDESVGVERVGEGLTLGARAR